jgi:hypothetical protein
MPRLWWRQMTGLRRTWGTPESPENPGRFTDTLGGARK